MRLGRPGVTVMVLVAVEVTLVLRGRSQGRRCRHRHLFVDDHDLVDLSALGQVRGADGAQRASCRR